MLRPVRVTLAAALVAAPTLVAASSAPAGAVFTPGHRLGVTAFSHLVVDDAHQHLFVSQGTASVVVTDLAGSSASTLGSLPGSTDLLLDASGSRVWVAVSGGAEIAAIDTATLAVTAYPTGAGTCPDQLAQVGDTVWFVDQCGSSAARLRRLDPTTGDVVDAGALDAGALIAASPGVADTLFVMDPEPSGAPGYVDLRFDADDVSGFPGQAITHTAETFDPVADYQVPAGIEASSGGRWVVDTFGRVYDATTLQARSQSSGVPGVVTAALRQDGQLAVAAPHLVGGAPSAVSSTALATIPVKGPSVAPSGLAYGDHDLYVVTHDASGYGITRTSLRRRDWLTMSGPRTAKYGRVVDLTVRTKDGVPIGARIDLYVKTQDFPERHLGHAKVGTDGRAHFRYKVDTEPLTLVATYAGDGDHTPATTEHEIYVRSVISLKAVHTLGKAHGEVRFRAGKRAHFVVRALPATADNCVEMALERKVRGRWYEAGGSGCVKVPTSGRVRIYVPNTGALVGAHFRAQAGLLDDPGSGWQYRTGKLGFTFVR